MCNAFTPIAILEDHTLYPVVFVVNVEFPTVMLLLPEGIFVSEFEPWPTYNEPVIESNPDKSLMKN